MYEEDEVYNAVRRGKKWSMPLGPKAPHVPNKMESKMLRRLMKKSGETEEQVRANIKNRRLLAQAAQSPAKTRKGENRKRSRREIEMMRLKRLFSKTLQLPVYDQDVEKAAETQINRLSFWF